MSAHSPAHATRGSRLFRSPLEYRPRGIAVHPARILERKRDCSQSNSAIAEPILTHDICFEVTSNITSITFTISDC